MLTKHLLFNLYYGNILLELFSLENQLQDPLDHEYYNHGSKHACMCNFTRQNCSFTLNAYQSFCLTCQSLARESLRMWITASIVLSDTHTIRSISATFIKWSSIHEKLPLNTKSGQIDVKSMLSSAIEEPFMAKCVLVYRLSLNKTNGASNNTNVSFSFNYSRSI